MTSLDSFVSNICNRADFCLASLFLFFVNHFLKSCKVFVLKPFPWARRNLDTRKSFICVKPDMKLLPCKLDPQTPVSCCVWLWDTGLEAYNNFLLSDLDWSLSLHSQPDMQWNEKLKTRLIANKVKPWCLWLDRAWYYVRR